MNKSLLYIYNLPVLFDLIKELEHNINFEIKYIKEKEDLTILKTQERSSYIILSAQHLDITFKDNILIIETWPIKFWELVQKINIFFLKQKYSDQSQRLIKEYKLDINSRELIKKNKKIKLTQKETEIILFLNNSQNIKSIENLQKEVWGHNSRLETHTVETHIYRLRKKILNSFKDKNFIISIENGYKI